MIRKCFGTEENKPKVSLEEVLVQNKEALESIYQMVTNPKTSIDQVCDDVVLNLKRILKTDCVAICRKKGRNVSIITLICDDDIFHDMSIPWKEFPSSLVYEKKETSQFLGYLGQMFPKNQMFSKYELNSYLGVPIYDNADGILGVLSVMDRAERVFSEEDIHLIKIFTHNVAHEMERQQWQRQVQKAEKMDMVFQIATGVAHEVRNPLNAILAISEALNQDLKENSEQQPLLNHINRQVDRLSMLMKDLLELGKPIQGSNLSRVNIHSICDSAIDLWEKTNPGKRMRINRIYHLSPPSLEVMVDSVKLQQVIFNLIDNAAYHNPERGEILLEVPEIQSENVHIRVVDEGSGIKPQYLTRVFEPFFTLRKGGTGLGLSIVKHIVEAFGGDISIRNNTPFPGVTVEIILPLAL